MPANPFVTELELVEKGEGELKYLVAETDRHPFVAQDIHELLEDVDFFDDADVFLLTEQMDLIPVYVAMGANQDEWYVTLGQEPGGDVIAHIIYADPGQDAAATDRHNVELYEQFANGWKVPDPA